MAWGTRDGAERGHVVPQALVTDRTGDRPHEGEAAGGGIWEEGSEEAAFLPLRLGSVFGVGGGDAGERTGKGVDVRLVGKTAAAPSQAVGGWISASV